MDDNRITEHFYVHEFDCRDGTAYPEDWYADRLVPLCESLEKIRSVSGFFPLHVLSGYRTEKHNTNVGGARNSQHLEGRAVDITSREISPDEVASIIESLIHQGEIPEGGLGTYKTFVHYDQRGFRARW